VRKISSGFTLIELVTIMIILGILAVMAIARMDTSGYRALEFHDKTVAALRFAQKTATSHRRMVCAAFTASTVTLTIAQTNPSASCVAQLLLPGANSNVVQSGDTTNAIFTTVPVSLYFQPDGRGTADIAGTTIYSDSPAISGQPDIVVVGATGSVY
jgi:type II secretory pathway pseudopilin PulG